LQLSKYRNIQSRLRVFLNLKAGEGVLLAFSGLYFYLLLCAYYIIRPIRNEMVIQNGVANIQWLLMAAAGVMILITPVFGWLTSRFKTQQFLTICTVFFALNLLIFAVLFQSNSDLTASIWVSRSFYVWVNVFNMFIISLFWSYMNDSFSPEQSKRLFSVIAAGGTAGALTGPLITVSLVESFGQGNLLFIAAGILSLTVICIFVIRAQIKPDSFNDDIHKDINSNDKLQGGILDGIKLTWQSAYLRKIAFFVITFAIISTFLAIELAAVIEQSFDSPEARTKLFSWADFAANSLTLILQIFLTGRLINWISYRYTLLILPTVFLLGFILIGFFPSIVGLIVLSILSRAGKYAILNPTSEMLFTIISREEKYKAKNFIDTAIVRSSNVLSSWLITLIKALGAGSVGVLAVGASLSVVWIYIANHLGNRYEQSTNKHQG